ncbi:MAG: uridine kinase [Gemmatimonadetes bacterium]|nr:uridine kinase [Gemmatimonadota bacterium]
MAGSRPLILGVAGGSGSGKTTVVSQIIRAMEPVPVSLLHHDSYYRDHPEMSPEERARLNYDHPDVLETELLAEHLRELMAGRAVEEPVYDFTSHSRTNETRRIEPNPIVIVDGILILAEPELRELMDIRVFVETDSDLRFIRRLLRDTQERGRSMGSVIRQYQETVRPMHLEFVEPSRRHADVILPLGRENRVAISMLVARLRARVFEEAD